MQRILSIACPRVSSLCGATISQAPIGHTPLASRHSGEYWGASLIISLRRLLATGLVLAGAVSGFAQTAQTITATANTGSTAYVNETVYFDASGSATGNYSWTGAFFSGSASWLGQQTWTTPGTYTVSVQSPASGGYAASNVVTITVNVLPLQPQTITASRTGTGNIYSGQYVQFSASGSGNGNYTWTGATASNPSSSAYWEDASSPGTYTVSVQSPASVSYAASNVVTITVTVLPPQTQTISASITTTGNIYAGSNVFFAASGTGEGQYLWTGATSEGGNGAAAFTSFSTPGAHTVSVQSPAFNSVWAASNVVTLTVNVLPPQTQTISASVTTTGNIYAGQYVYFAASGTSDNQYTWTGATSEGGNGSAAYTTFSTPGTHTVSVQAPALGGVWAASNVVTLTVNVLPPQPQTITAAIVTAGPIYEGYQVSFSASGSSYGLYTWTGATGSGNGATATKTFYVPGTYTVSVQAPAIGGVWAASNIVNLSVTVVAPQPQTISASISTTGNLYPNESVYFTVTGDKTGMLTWTPTTVAGGYSGYSGIWRTPGTYTVTVQDQGNAMWAPSNIFPVTVTIVPPQPQTVTLTPKSQRVAIGAKAYLTPSGVKSDYVWGGTANVAYYNGYYTALPSAGTYSVTLQADAAGAPYYAYAASNVATAYVTALPSLSQTTNTGTAGGGYLARLWSQLIASVGGPIQLPTGAESFSRTLFSFSGARHWQFAISYNSALASSETQPGILGYGWSSRFEASIVPSGSYLIVNWDSTHSNTFIPVAGSPGVFTSPSEGAKYVVVTANAGGGWTLKNRDQSSLIFDANGRLIEDLDANGRELALSYNSSGQLASITDLIGATSLTFGYNSSGLVTSLTDGTGAAVAFTYNAQTYLLTQIVNQNGNHVTFAYDGSGNILTLTGNDGTVLTTNTYDSLGRAVTQADAVSGHAPLQLSYQQASVTANIVTTVTDKTGAVSIYTSDSNYHLLSVQNPLNEVTHYTYDSLGNLLSQTDPLGHVTHYTYDSSGNLLTTVDPAGKVTTCTYDSRNNLLSVTDPAGGVTTRTYDANNNLLTLTDPLGQTTTWTYDQNSMPLTKTLPRGGTYHYTNAGGQVAQVTDPDGVTKTFAYDADSRLTAQQDALGNQTAYAYDPIGNLVTTTNPLNQTTTSSYDFRNRTVSSTDAAGATTHYSYDNNNNLLSSTDPLGNVTGFAYDGDDRLISTTDPRGKTTTRSYDSAGETTATSDATGATTTYSYDAAGHRTAVVDPLGNRTTVTFDPRGLPLTVTDPLGRATQMSYDNLGRQTASTDPLNQTTSSAFDSDSHLVGVTDPGSLATAQAFDPDGNRVGLTDANGHVANFAFDLSGRATSATTPAGRATTFSYDPRGLLLTTTLPSGHTTTVTDDAAGRLSSVADGVGTIAYTRDSDGRTLTVSENGQTLARTYDSSGRLTQYVDGAGNVMGYQYDAAGNLSVLTYPDGKTVTYGYDAANRMTSVTDWAGRVTTYTYNPAGRLTQTSRPNGTSQVRTYDAANQLTGLSEVGPGGTTVIYSEACSYDADGRLSTENLAPSQVTGTADVVGTYGYDASHRVTSWQDTLSNQTTCSYDSVANLLGEIDQFPASSASSGQINETFDSDNRLLTFAGQAASFDPDGNLLSLPGAAPAAYSYDTRGRLTSADALTYAYNSEGNRTSVTDATGTTQYAINPNAPLSQVLMRTAPNGTVTDYVYGLGLAYEDTGGAGTYYHYDRRGNTVALTNDSGAVQGQVTYGIYGQILSTVGQTTTPFLFNGLYGVMTDSNGLYYHRARYYSPQLRRFVSQDFNLGGISVAASMNRYAYANGNPVNAIDPFGLMATDLNPWGSDSGSLLDLINSFLQPAGAWMSTQSMAPDSGNNSVTINQAQAQAAPTLPNGQPAPPPIPLPSGKDGQPNSWRPVPGTQDRPIKWVPTSSIPGQSQPAASWDPQGHWDGDDGLGNPGWYDPSGNPITPEQAHGSSFSLPPISTQTKINIGVGAGAGIGLGALLSIPWYEAAPLLLL
jgi:RHS repeat-associated protein